MSGDHAWIEEQACSGLDVSPAQFRAALEAPDNVKLVHEFLERGARRSFCVHARTAGGAACSACTQRVQQDGDGTLYLMTNTAPRTHHACRECCALRVPA